MTAWGELNGRRVISEISHIIFNQAKRKTDLVRTPQRQLNNMKEQEPSWKGTIFVLGMPILIILFYILK